MSRARHHEKKAKKAGGGEVYYAGGSSNVAKEAAKKKRGGAVEGSAAEEKGESKQVEKMEGEKAKRRMDKRPRRASGGRVGSDKNPFSSAARPGQNTEAAKP